MPAATPPPPAQPTQTRSPAPRTLPADPFAGRAATTQPATATNTEATKEIATTKRKTTVSLLAVGGVTLIVAGMMRILDWLGRQASKPDNEKMTECQEGVREWLTSMIGDGPALTPGYNMILAIVGLCGAMALGSRPKKKAEAPTPSNAPTFRPPAQRIPPAARPAFTESHPVPVANPSPPPPLRIVPNADTATTAAQPATLRSFLDDNTPPTNGDAPDAKQTT